ncbi:MAG: tripartite tricarboxylate transporter substrate binding protein [Casimicrobiaceae bacterium]
MTYLRSLVALAALVAATAVGAQDYPTRAVRMIVPWTPGGGADTVARLIAAKLTEAWGQPVVIENKGGATGTVGTDLVAKSTPDGYTLVLGTNSTYVIAISMYNKLPYDPEKDLTPISKVAEVPHILNVNAALPVNNVAELLALVKAKPGEIAFGSSGSGSTPHVAGEIFMNLTGTKLLHVPYKGSGQSLADTVAGNVQVSFDTLPSVLPFVQAGRLRPLAVLGPKRVSALPNLPTSAEAGVPGAEGVTWFGLYGPAHMPPAIVKKIHDEVARIVKLPDVKAKLETFGATETADVPSDEFAASVKVDIVKYSKILQAAGMQKE